jgi:hypothetical protein
MRRKRLPLLSSCSPLRLFQFFFLGNIFCVLRKVLVSVVYPYFPCILFSHSVRLGHVE